METSIPKPLGIKQSILGTRTQPQGDAIARVVEFVASNFGFFEKIVKQIKGKDKAESSKSQLVEYFSLKDDLEHHHPKRKKEKSFKKSKDKIHYKVFLILKVFLKRKFRKRKRVRGPSMDWIFMENT